MNKQKYSVAIIGTGRIGFSLGFDKKREQPASHTMAVLQNKRLKLTAACDSDKTKLEYFKRFNKNVQTYENIGQLLASEKPDIVIIAVNEFSHLETTLSVIKSKPKLIVLEKPVALSVAEGLQIKEKAEKYSVPILINHERRFAVDYNIAKKYIKKIGEIVSINSRLDSGLRVYGKEFEKSGEYSLIHDGTHLVDIVSFLTDDKIFSDLKISNITNDKNDKSVVREITFSCKNEICDDINFQISGKSKFFGFEIDIFGTLGRIRIGNGVFEFYERKKSKLYSGFYSLEIDKKVKKPKKTKYFANMIQNSVDFLDGKSEIKSTLNNGIETLKILEEVKNLI